MYIYIRRANGLSNKCKLLRENEQELNSMIEKNPLLHELLRPLTNEKKERKKKGNPITRVIRFIENLFIP